MNYLIDTHTFLWAVFEPDRLGGKARTILQDPGQIIYVGAVSFLEISLKYALGKLELYNILPDQFPEVARRMKFEILNLTSPEAASFYKLPKVRHQDPFDRMIVWQAIHRKMVLISKDKQLRLYKDLGLKVVW